MGKSLVIVESRLRQDHQQVLGNEYVVKSSIGHIRDLPTSGSASASKEPAAKRGKAAAGEGPVLSPKEKARKQLVSRMGVDQRSWLEGQVRNPSGQGKRSSKSFAGSPRMRHHLSREDLAAKGKPLPGTCASIGGDDSRLQARGGVQRNHQKASRKPSPNG